MILVFGSTVLSFPLVLHEPILCLSTGNCFTGFHADNRPPTEVVASLLRGRKLWIFASPGSKEAANLLKKPEANHLDCLLGDMIFHRHKNSLYCVQEAGYTVRFPARTVRFVLSVAVDGGWNCLLSHNILHSEEEASELERKAFNRYSDQRSRTKLGKGAKCPV